MSELKRMLARGLRGYEPPEGALDPTLHRVHRRQRNRRITAATLALVVTVAGVAVAARQFSGKPPTPVDIVPEGSDGVLVFAINTGSEGKRDLYSILPDGTGMRRLTNTPDKDEAFPAVSPDGRLVSFVDVKDSEGELGFVGIDGSQVAQPSALRTVSNHSGISWSPDGGHVAFAGGGSGIQLQKVVYDGTFQAPRQIGCSAGCGGDGDPAWSPDGRTIAFSRTGFGFGSFSRLLLVSVLGEDVRGLPPDEFPGAMDPVWSPDSREIAAESNQRIIRIDVETGAVHEVWRTPAGRVFDPSWSPDGSRIAFLTPQGGIRITAAHDPTINKTAFKVADLDPTVTDLTWGAPAKEEPDPAPSSDPSPETLLACDPDSLRVEVGHDGATMSIVPHVTIQPGPQGPCILDIGVTLEIEALDGSPLAIEGNPGSVHLEGELRTRAGARWQWWNWCGSPGWRVRATVGDREVVTEGSGRPACNFPDDPSTLTRAFGIRVR